MKGFGTTLMLASNKVIFGGAYSLTAGKFFDGVGYFTDRSSFRFHPWYSLCHTGLDQSICLVTQNWRRKHAKKRC